MALILLLVLVAIVLGIVGVVAHGLFYLLIIGIAVFLIALIFGALRFRRAGQRPQPLNVSHTHPMSIDVGSLLDPGFLCAGITPATPRCSGTPTRPSGLKRQCTKHGASGDDAG